MATPSKKCWARNDDSREPSLWLHANRHCEERSDEAIQKYIRFPGWPRPAKNAGLAMTIRVNLAYGYMRIVIARSVATKQSRNTLGFLDGHAQQKMLGSQ